MDGTSVNENKGPPLSSDSERWWSGEAIVSIVCGVASIPLFFVLVPSVIAIVYGWAGIRQCSFDATYLGKRIAVAGLILGVITLLAGILLWLTFWSAYPFETN